LVVAMSFWNTALVPVTVHLIAAQARPQFKINELSPESVTLGLLAETHR